MSWSEKNAREEIGGELGRPRFWRSWIKVMLVQAAILLLLWALQARWSA